MFQSLCLNFPKLSPPEEGCVLGGMVKEARAQGSQAALFKNVSDKQSTPF